MSLPNPITKMQLETMQVSEWEQCDAAVFGPIPEGTLSEYGNRTPADIAAEFLVAAEGECPACCHRIIDWSLTHGEAHCTNCGYPARVYHYFLAPDSYHDVRIVKPLWYHPLLVEVRE